MSSRAELFSARLLQKSASHVSIASRKEDHIDIVLGGGGASRVTTSLEKVIFEHCALPELGIDDIDLATDFLGHRLAAPLLISSMTGGPARLADLNLRLAEVAESLAIAFAVGSQRVALEEGATAGLGRELRRVAPNAMILANFGAVQLGFGYGKEHALRAIDMIGADALILHLNPLQEALQPEGDRDFSGLFARIESLIQGVNIPVVVKEVGCGVSVPVARRLVDAGVAAIDCAGAGGTSWAAVESVRATGTASKVAATFAGWGIPTAYAIEALVAAKLGVPIIASGGLRNGLDIARAIRLGACLGGQAAAALPAATETADAVLEHFQSVIEELRVACFCTGSRNPAELVNARLLNCR